MLFCKKQTFVLKRFCGVTDHKNNTFFVFESLEEDLSWSGHISFLIIKPLQQRLFNTAFLISYFFSHLECLDCLPV